jgi:hypothetical protein
VFVHSYAAAPQDLIKALSPVAEAKNLHDIEMAHILTAGQPAYANNPRFS